MWAPVVLPLRAACPAPNTVVGAPIVVVVVVVVVIVRNVIMGAPIPVAIQSIVIVVVAVINARHSRASILVHPE